MQFISSRYKVIMNLFACLVLILIMGIELVIVLANAHDESSSNSIGRIAGLWAATLLILQFVLSEVRNHFSYLKGYYYGRLKTSLVCLKCNVSQI